MRFRLMFVNLMLCIALGCSKSASVSTAPLHALLEDLGGDEVTITVQAPGDTCLIIAAPFSLTETWLRENTSLGGRNIQTILELNGAFGFENSPLAVQITGRSFDCYGALAGFEVDREPMRLESNDQLVIRGKHISRVSTR